MKLLIACPPNLLKPVHIEAALSQAAIEPSELLLPKVARGSTDSWLREWATTKSLSVDDYERSDMALNSLMSAEESAVLAIMSPDHQETLDLVAKAASNSIPVYL